jgi:hypothetical protein
VRARTELSPGAALVTGQRPLSPLVVLAAGEARGAVADGGLSTRRARGGKFPEEISDEGAPQGPQAPTKEGLDGPERTRTIRQDSSQNVVDRTGPGTAEPCGAGTGPTAGRASGRPIPVFKRAEAGPAGSASVFPSAKGNPVMQRHCCIKL